MKLITEAALDDQFNAQMLKIQTAIEALEKLPAKFAAEKTMPVGSQVNTIDRAAKDLQHLSATFSGLRT